MADKKAAYKLNPENWPEMVARCSYPNLFKAKAIKDGAKKSYSIELLFDKTEVKLSKFLKPLYAAATDKWGEDREQWPTPFRLAVRDGDVPKMDKESKKKIVKPEHKGMWVVKAASGEEYPPQVVGKNPKQMITDQKKIYAGCYVRVAIMAHAYEYSESATGVKFILDAVQFWDEGEPLARQNSAALFGAGASDEETEELPDDELGGGDKDFEAEESFL